jgi:hypothetical protein
LEYVSESGKVFKTDKGKVLMFKEGVFGDIGDAIDSGIRGVKKFFKKAKFKKGDKIMLCLADFSPSLVQHGLEVIDVQYGGWSGGWEYKTGVDDWGNSEWWPEERVAIDTDPDAPAEKYDPEKFPEFSKFKKFAKESGRRFGRKFNESDDEIRDAVNDAYDKYRACSTVPKVCQAIKINDDGTEQKIGIWMDHGNSIGGIVKAIKDGRLRKVLKFSESSKKFGKKFNESYHGRVEVKASIVATGRTAEEALELLHNRLLDADAKIIDENEKPNPEIVDKYNYWFDENMGDVDFDICRDNNPNGFIQMDIKTI